MTKRTRRNHAPAFKAKVLIEAWRRQYNTIRPHSSLGYRPPPPAALKGVAPATENPAKPPCN